MAKEKVSRYNLVTGEDTYASQVSQNPATSRKLQSWIPADDGQLTRELLQVQFDTTQLSGPVVALYEYDYNDLNGNVLTIFFAAARTNFVGAKTCSLYYKAGAGHWARIDDPSLTGGTTNINPMADAPAFATINNLLHVTDGVNSWVYDGVLNLWFAEGFATRTEQPSLNVVGGAINFAVGKYYWISYADHNENHESDATGVDNINSGGQFVAFSGALVAKNVRVYPSRGLTSCVAGSALMTQSASGDAPGPSGGGDTIRQIFDNVRRVGVWINGTQLLDAVGNPLYITSFSAGVNIGLNAAAQVTIPNGRALFAPLRSTHWHVYCSEVDGSKVGQFLAAVPVTRNLATTPFVDSDPGITSSASTMLPIFRPVRNDQPPPSKVLAVHKYRQWRIRQNKPTFFSFSANEEVTSGANGSPQESWPGTSVTNINLQMLGGAADPGTVSDIVNEYPYPDQSNRIRALISHADALYMFSEKQGLPLYGESLDDFALSQVTAFSLGISGRFGGDSTPHGLAFLAYDRTFQLYPTANYPWASVPKDVNVTDSLIELGKPQRKTWELIKTADLDTSWVRGYRYGRRDWVIVSTLQSGTDWSTYAYDFSTKGWFKLQQGYESLAVFEIANGKVLVGGGQDGYVWVVDDITGTYTSAGPHPNAIWRPALIDFGDPDSKHIFKYVEFEFSSAALEGDTRINYYLDPVDVDNPGTPRTLTLQKVQQVGANLYRGWPKGGNTCHRLLLEINTAASANVGSIRSAKIVAEKVTGVIA